MMRRYLDRATLATMFSTALFVILPLVALAQSNDGGGLVGLIGGGIGCLFGLVMLGIWIAITVWAYRDAQARGENGVLWAVIVFFLGLIGLVIWLVVRSNKPRLA